MRRFGKLIFVIICVCLLTTTVFAQTVATTVSTRAIVSANGQATVTMTVNILLDNPSSGLTFPLPAAAQNVAMNGSSIRTYSSAYDKNVVLADLSAYDGYTGQYQLVFSYTLEDVLRTELKEKREESLLLLELPLLCGFEYPVEKMDFSVTMPGDLTTEKISFTSGVMQTGIESIIKYSMGGQRVDGVVNQTLQDRETVTLVMQVKEEMFPGKLVIPREGNPEIVPMAIFAALALLYWIIFMRTLPVIRHRRTTLIEGVTAGELGSRLTAAGADLTMMVFSWAQLGYVRIHTDRYGRVIVEKRMDMGNERTEFERRCFASLFSRGDAVDATGMRYAKLCRHVSEFIPGIREMYTKRSGNIVIFRCLFCVVSIFCGICYGKNLIPEGWLQTLVVIVLATLGAITAWAIQDGMYKLHVRGKIPLYVSSACSVLWMVLGIVSGVWIIALVTVLGQGTEFIVRLTLELQKDARSGAIVSDCCRPKPLQVDFTGKKALLVEDNEVNREIMTMLLANHGLKVDVATNGREAVDAIAASRPGSFDVVLMDIQMPVMDGYEATVAIRNLDNRELANVPIVAVTANAFGEDARKAFEVGMNGHVAKPVDPDKLMAVLTEVLSSSPKDIGA